MVTSVTITRVVRILADRAYGPGLTVTKLRQLYPCNVRRLSLLETLRHLEELELIRRKKDRVWWIGPIPLDARPLGLRAARLRRAERMTPRERVAAYLKMRSQAPSPGKRRG